MGGKLEEKKSIWGRPKGVGQTPETKKKISDGVKKAYQKIKGNQ